MTEDEMKQKWLVDVMAKDPAIMDDTDEYDWESMAYGFFLALGATPEDAQRMAFEVET